MLFNSWDFIFGFLPVAVLGFQLIPAMRRDARKLWLVAASLFFYGWWKLEYVPLLLGSIGFNFGIAEWLVRWRERPARRTVLWLGVGGNLALLAYYKYTNFFAAVIAGVIGREETGWNILLPLAISFFTFTQIAYLVDVSRDSTRHHSLLDYSLFVVFFPHLIAGPIVRHWEIIPQYTERELRANRADWGVGLTMFLLGLYKKVLLADPAAVVANAVFSAAEHGVVVPWFDAWLGTLAYAGQIYFDFSGYSDMAIGLARLFGIKFPVNFNSPYKAGSITEFWQRWHITLTRFLREYVYFPLGGNRCAAAKHVFNILATMFLSGLWHGAGWTFVLWGGFHGLCLLANHEWRAIKERFAWKLEHWSYRTLCAALTFVVVLSSWVLFRSPTLVVAGRMTASLAAQHGLTMSIETTNPTREPGKSLAKCGVQFVGDVAGLKSYTDAIKLVVLLLLVAWCFPNTQQLLRDYDPVIERNAGGSRLRLRLQLWTGLAFGALFFGVVRSHYTTAPSPFLYFNF